MSSKGLSQVPDRGRSRLLALVVVAVVAAAGIGWYAGAQIARRRRSPPSRATAAFQHHRGGGAEEAVGDVSQGDVVFDDDHAVLSGSFAQQPERLVVTRSVEEDTELAEGDVAVEVVGRPVFLLQGDIPMYRDLRPGATGDDVLQLEEALARLGVFAGEPDGTWDQMTGAAVAAWYEQAGYRPNGLSDEDEEALRAARDRVRAAESALADAGVRSPGGAAGLGPLGDRRRRGGAERRRAGPGAGPDRRRPGERAGGQGRERRRS